MRTGYISNNPPDDARLSEKCSQNKTISLQERDSGRELKRGGSGVSVRPVREAVRACEAAAQASLIMLAYLEISLFRDPILNSSCSDTYLCLKLRP